MHNMHTIIVLGGSMRRDSWNHKTAVMAAAGIKGDDIEVRTLHLADFPMPVYNEDTEAQDTLGEGVQALRSHFRAAQGVLLGVPEYNAVLPGALKNAIDWLTRPVEGGTRLDCFSGKVVALVSASPGQLGGIRGLPTTRMILSSIGMHVLPDQMAVGGVQDALQDEAMQGRLAGVGAALANAVRRLH